MESFWPLLALPNVTWLGDVPYPQVPGLMSCADVAVIPHRVGSGEVGGDPLKVYEYAAVGARIATTPITGSERFARFAEVVAAGDEFVRGVVGLGLDHRTLTERLDSSSIGEEESWDARANALMETLRRATSVIGRGRAA